MKIKVLVFSIFLSVLSVNCNKKDIEPDFTVFLNTTTPGFIGNIDGVPFNWQALLGQYGISNAIVDGVSIPYDLDENERILVYSLTPPSNIFHLPDFCNNQETNTITLGLDISTPKFNHVSDDIFDSSLRLGKKNIGTLENAFNISVYVNSKKYCVRDYSEGIEILKTEMIEVGESNHILVWLVLNDIVLDANEDESSITISNGKIIARFYYSSI